jgi:hypothetical protein
LLSTKRRVQPAGVEEYVKSGGDLIFDGIQQNMQIGGFAQFAQFAEKLLLLRIDVSLHPEERLN